MTNQNNGALRTILIDAPQRKEETTNHSKDVYHEEYIFDTDRNVEDVDDSLNESLTDTNTFYSIWLKLEPYFFPIIPKSPSSFVSFLFWHSLLLTASTPLARLMRGQWMGIFTVESVLSLFGLETRSAVHPDAYLIYPQNGTLDAGFSFHAFFGLLWLLMAFVQMVPLATKFKRAHKIFGYIIQLSFVAHLVAAITLLLIDTQQHHWLPKCMLMSPVLRSGTYMVLGIQSIRSGDLSQHIDRMFRCFIYSIEGAGTIRTVGYLLWLAGLGPTFCQSAHGATATYCVAPYVLQLVCIRLLSMYWIGCYARMRACPDFTKSFLVELVTTGFSLIGAYSYAAIVVG